jgi:MraZ protein
MFRGRYMHTIDAKGRVSLPAELRMELQRRSEHAPFLTNMPDHLALYPHEDWLAYEEQLFAPDPFMPEAQDLQLFMLSGAAPCAADNQGRILIPPALREHARLDKDVVIAGAGKHIQIWDRARFDQFISRTQSSFRELASVVSTAARASKQRI